MSLLALRGVNAYRRGRPVLEAVGLEVHRGEVVGLLGPNGSGKTTLLRAALGLHPARGQIELSGAPLASLSP